MSTIPTSYTTAAEAVRQITAQTASLTARIDTAIERMAGIRAELDAMATPFPNGWLDAVQFIDAQAAANPADDVWAALKAEKNKLVVDFTAQKNRAAGIEAAISGL